MAFERISEEELASVGVEMLDDVPSLEPGAMKAKFEETAKKLIAPKFNKLAEQLEAETGAGSIGAQIPDGLPEDTAKTVQAVLIALMIYVQTHEEKQDNPHNVNAEQVGAYTKAQTDKAIKDKVVEIGAGDMSMSVYDPGMLKKPIYQAIAEAIEALKKLVLDKEHYDPRGKGTDIFAEISANAPMYTALYTLDGWTEADEDAKGKGYAYQQTVTLTPDDPDAPTVTADSVFVTGCSYLPTGVVATDEVLDEALTAINAGYTTSGTGTVTTLVVEKPAADISVRWAIRTEVT